jgi:hypothetical protein
MSLCRDPLSCVATAVAAVLQKQMKVMIWLEPGTNYIPKKDRTQEGRREIVVRGKTLSAEREGHA